MALLERLSTGRAGPRAAEQVARHLEALLNSERGFGSVLEDFGVRSEAKWGAPGGDGTPRDPMERLRLELERNIERYERSLQSFTLKAVARDAAGDVRFRLAGRLENCGEEISLQLAFNVWTRRVRVREERS